MSETVVLVDYYYAVVGDRPGEARRLLEHLSEKGVNLIAFTVFPVAGNKSQLDFFPQDARLLEDAAGEAGISLVGPKKAFLITGDDRVGALHDHHLKLANANINVHAANGVASGAGRYGYILWVEPEDIPRAMEVLQAGETEGRFGALRPGDRDW